MTRHKSATWRLPPPVQLERDRLAITVSVLLPFVFNNEMACTVRESFARFTVQRTVSLY
jgi:hypothetical protein